MVVTFTRTLVTKCEAVRNYWRSRSVNLHAADDALHSPNWWCCSAVASSLPRSVASGKVVFDIRSWTLENTAGEIMVWAVT